MTAAILKTYTITELATQLEKVCAVAERLEGIEQQLRGIRSTIEAIPRGVSAPNEAPKILFTLVEAANRPTRPEPYMVIGCFPLFLPARTRELAAALRIRRRGNGPNKKGPARLGRTGGPLFAKR